MIEKDDAFIEFYGKAFKPSVLANILPLSNITEPGSIGLRGRYKGLPYPYGSASIFLPPEVDGEDLNHKIDLLLKQIEENKEAIDKAQIESIIVDIYVGYRDQCNLAFNASILKRLGDLNISINLSAVDYELFDIKTETHSKLTGINALDVQEPETEFGKFQTKTHTNGGMKRAVKPLAKAVKQK